ELYIEPFSLAMDDIEGNGVSVKRVSLLKWGYVERAMNRDKPLSCWAKVKNYVCGQSQRLQRSIVLRPTMDNCNITLLGNGAVGKTALAKQVSSSLDGLRNTISLTFG